MVPTAGSITIIKRTSVRAFLLSCWMGLNLVPVIAATAEPITLTLNLHEPGPEISPSIYGQFIEHLGRCIRDGIWAEKLRDRKFLLEPGKSWQVLKPAGTLFEAYLDPAGAYAGDHCMALWLREPTTAICGIQQDKLGLTAGKEYTGYAVLAGVQGKTEVELRLSWGNSPDAGQSIRVTDLSPVYRKVPFRFRAASGTDAGSFSVYLRSPGCVWVGCLSLMPADTVKGMRADTLKLIRKLNPPIIRWPGGNFVSGYNWKDGIGDRDRRPPRWERAWNDVEDNDFGIDEFMRFCAELQTEPYIAVNTGLGSVQNVVDELEYVTGSARTRWGGERARNGHRSPYQVTWWGVGNEMFGDWQLGNVPVERYAMRHNAFASAMLKKNSEIKIIAVGAPGKWNDVILPRCAGHMTLLSGHHYTERKFKVPFTEADLGKYEADYPAYSGKVAGGIRNIVTDFRQRLGKGNATMDRVRLAVDEWGIVRDWNASPDGPGVGSFEHYYPLGDAIAAARALHELLRSADVVAMANWAQTVNVIATIKTRRDQAVLDPTGHVLALYRAELSGRLLPLRVAGQGSIDAVATWDPKRGKVAMGLVNYSPSQTAEVAVRLAGANASSVSGWRINGASLGSINVPGESEAVTTQELAEVVDWQKPMRLPAHSITVLKVGAK